MNSDVIVDVIGNTAPFSLMGESSGYMVTVNDSTYLLECGSPIFPTLGYNGIVRIKGLFATHSHEDHKRWFTDIVLFAFYHPLFKGKIKLIGSESVLEEYSKNSKGALERSLSLDAKRIVDIPYSAMVEEVIIGPRSKYPICLKSDEVGSFYYRVEDREGNLIGPEKAKIFINPVANRPRLLFKDDESGEWVEPESYYPFSSTAFYEQEQNVFHDEEAGLTVRAVKSSAWHGVPTVALKFMAGKNYVFYSADTAYKLSLWEALHKEYRPQKFDSLSREDFEKSPIISGDINDFIERTWSLERYKRAMSAYKGSFVIHDVARKNSIVHTDYADIADAPIENIIYTHNPDNLTAWKFILTSDKRVIIKNGKLYESVQGKLYPLDADVYVRHFSCNIVGYQSKKGAYKVIKKDGLLGVAKVGGPGKSLMRVDLYQDVKGGYFPFLEDPCKRYLPMPDGTVEEMTMSANSTVGKVVKSLRGRIKKKGTKR